MTRFLFNTPACIMLALLSACSESKQNTQTSAVETLAGTAVQRHFDPQQVAMGEKVFTTHCQKCHGNNAEGAPNWRIRNADGSFPPPPLNGSGHAWHHDKLQLKHQIRYGSQQGQGNMPPFKDRLSEQEIEAVLVWIQSLWPQEVYAAWYDMHGSQ